MERTTALDLDQLRDALAVANLPSLLAVIVHLSGDRRFLDEPYRPTRGRMLDDNDSGGYSEEIQQELRDRAFELVVAWHAGAFEAPALEPDDLVEIFDVALAESVEPRYGELLAFEMGLDRSGSGRRPVDVDDDYLVAIIGAGPSGLAMADELRETGIPFVVIDKDDGPGGTWLENRYPGCGCDTPSHFYSFRQRANAPGWARYYAGRDELFEYFTECAKEFGVMEHLRPNTTVLRSVWDGSTGRWSVHVRDRDGRVDVLHANVVVNATGMLNRPSVPRLEGLETFAGPAFHTARWPDEVDVSDRRVGVIGTGASAMQVVPTIAGTARHVTVFQRSPQWAVPNPQYKRAVSEQVRYLMAYVPYYASWYRTRLLWILGDRLHRALQVDPAWPHPDRSINALNDSVRSFLTSYIVEELGDRADELLPKVLPDYPPFAKRILMDNGWFRTVARDDVTLATERIVRIEPGGVRSGDGTLHELDVLVLATGFESLNYLGDMDFVGAGGASLRATWGPDDARAYLGIAVPDFPNLFFLYGPNTNAHAGSVIHYSQRQAHYVTELIRLAVEEGIDVLDCDRGVFDNYISRLDDAHSRMVWTHPGVSTYYRNTRGRVVNNSPWRQVDYFHMTANPRLEDYAVHRAAAGPPVP